MQPIELGRICRHCEERSDEAIHNCRIHTLDCFAALAMTVSNPLFCPLHFWLYSEEAPTGRANARPMTGSAPSRRMKPRHENASALLKRTPAQRIAGPCQNNPSLIPAPP